MPDGSADRPRDLLVSGHVNVDRFLAVDRFPALDRTVPARAQRVALGGTAANLALVAARAGLSVGLVARIGEGFPSAFLGRLRAAGIDLRGLTRTTAAATPTCTIIEDRGGRQRTLIDQGAMADLRRAARPGAWMGEYAWLHLTTGDPDYQLRLAERAHRLGVRVAADPAQEIHYRWDRRRLLALLARSDLLFGNQAEIARAEKLLGVRSVPSLLERVPLIVRTEGGRGASAFFRNAGVHVPAARPRRVLTAVGAGDAFRGGFYSGWFAGESLRDCLAAGTRTARAWLEAGA